VLNNKADPAVREARFRELFHEDFDCPVLHASFSSLIGRRQAKTSRGNS
jgi:hypothetical protein